ncbi:MFS transporter [Nocardia sp. KC 131]|uniref:MFS transporter n=1 Tax=Nocardia arseniciresistens TaxID=3392119 RepID=UPI00398E8C94
MPDTPSVGCGSSATRLIRDRTTWLHYAQLGALGYFQFGFGSSVLLFREESGVSRTVAGMYGPALAVGTIAGGVLFPHLTRRLPLGVVLTIGLTGLAVGAGMFCLSSSVTGTLLATVIAMTFGILVLSGVSTGLSDHHGTISAAAISEANAASAGMGFLAPLLTKVAVDAGMGWRAALGLTFVLAGTLAALTASTRWRSPADSNKVAVQRDSTGKHLPRRFWLAWSCLLAIESVEAGLILWAAEQLHERTGVSADTAGIAVSAVLGGMLVGRLGAARVAVRIANVPLMFGAIATAAAGFAVFWLATEPAIALAGLLCCGLGMSLHFPLSVALTMEASNQQFELAMSRNSYGVAFGFGVAPFLLGALSDLLGIRWAFCLVPCCLFAAALSLGQLARLQRQDRVEVSAPTAM